MSLEKRLKRGKKGSFKIKLMVSFVIVLTIIGLVLTFISPLRFDFAGGNHRIFPIAMDNDIWGNYMVYYRSNDFSNTGYYYIDREDKDLAEHMTKAIAESKEVIIYYDPYLGWKGFNAPKTAPITRMEIIRTEVNSNKIKLNNDLRGMQQLMKKIIYQ